MVNVEGKGGMMVFVTLSLVNNHKPSALKGLPSGRGFSPGWMKQWEEREERDAQKRMEKPWDRHGEVRMRLVEARMDHWE